MRTVLISDFNVDPLRAALTLREVEATRAPFGSVMESLASEQAEAWLGAPGAAVLWTRPESVIPTFAHALGFAPVDVEVLLADVDAFAQAVQRAAARVEVMFVASWVLAPHQRGYGMLDRHSGVGLADLLARMNLRLAEALGADSNVYVLDAARWLQAAGVTAFSSKMWYLAKVPFENAVFAAAAADVARALGVLRGEFRRLIVVDLDDTMWGGIVGEVGWQKLELGGHSPTGEAHVDFQKGLQALSRRGVALAIVSKNTESVALEAIREHPEMVLRLEDFAGWRINWQDKAANLLELVDELNFGLNSVVFLDDSPAERARVREALPDVFVPEWPANKLLYTETLLALDCFDTAAITAEDRQRGAMYARERERRSSFAKASSIDDWLAGLEVVVTAEELSEGNLVRAAQLLNKTNQMNMATRRMPEAEFQAWAEQEGHHVWTFRVADRYGDSGLTGIISLQRDGRVGRIADFLLSCRVMGRRVEDVMLHALLQFAEQAGVEVVRAEFLATARNQPCLEVLARSVLHREGADATTFTWRAGQGHPKPGQIELVHA